jgi:UDP-xylose/UDP-N-acetylglucosamine transporter B4
MLMHLLLAAGSIGYTEFHNAALGTALPTIVLIMLKNGNLVANMLVGVAVLRRQYGVREVLGVLCISGGLILTSIAGGQKETKAVPGAGGSAILGVALLAGALLSRAMSGCLQEINCDGSMVQEILLYRNLFSLPIILTHWHSIYDHVRHWNSAGSSLGGFEWFGPWGLLATNVVFDHCARVCVSHLIDQTSALTANLVLTLQRFIAFVISALLLSQEDLGLDIWLGAIAVVLGSLIYAAASKPQPIMSAQKKSE